MEAYNLGDYESNYGEDPYMKEVSDSAPGGRVYLEEPSRVYRPSVNGWISNLDTLLIFAVLATFVFGNIQDLQSDGGADTQSLLTPMVIHNESI